MSQCFNGERICNLTAGERWAVYGRGDNGTFLTVQVTPAIKSNFLHCLLTLWQNWCQMGSHGHSHRSKVT